MGVAAAQRAISDAGVAPGQFDPERCGVVFGADYMLSQPEELAAGFNRCTDEQRKFNFGRWGVDGLGQLTPLWLLKYLPNMPASHVAIYNDFRGPNNSLTLREAAGNLSVGEAARYIERGDADLMVAGATGTRVHPLKAVHTSRQEEIATNGVAPERASRPFDLHRTGMVVGEGAGVVVLESLESAQARGATIYCELLGSGSSVVADRSGVPHRDVALTNAIRGALRDAGLSEDAVGHIHAHGLSTRACDVEEARAIRSVFGDRANELPVTAAKSYFGNLGAGSGVVELIASVLALRAGRLFPVLNFESPDPECPIHVAQAADTSPGDSFLNLSATPQGQASAIVVGRV
jgi:3-oxoacyl-[acyl-carrier-protein] synthase II